MSLENKRISIMGGRTGPIFYGAQWGRCPGLDRTHSRSVWRYYTTANKASATSPTTIRQVEDGNRSQGASGDAGGFRRGILVGRSAVPFAVNRRPSIGTSAFHEGRDRPPLQRIVAGVAALELRGQD
jgi:hypothetical protein